MLRVIVIPKYHLVTKLIAISMDSLKLVPTNSQYMLGCIFASIPHACPGPSWLIQVHIIAGVALMFQVTPTTHSHGAHSASADLSHAYSHLSEPNISILAL